MPLVFDAFAVMAWLLDEPGAQQVEDWLNKAEQRNAGIFASAVNVGEVYYRLQRRGQSDAAEEFLQNIQSAVIPLNVVAATNGRVWAAARLKARYPIAYADGFAAALAQELDSPLLTGDREFESLADDGVLKVVWL